MALFRPLCEGRYLTSEASQEASEFSIRCLEQGSGSVSEKSLPTRTMRIHEKKSLFLNPAVINRPNARAFVSHMTRASFFVLASIRGTA